MMFGRVADAGAATAPPPPTQNHAATSRMTCHFMPHHARVLVATATEFQTAAPASPDQ
jgi:hypothetical protein